MAQDMDVFKLLQKISDKQDDQDKRMIGHEKLLHAVHQTVVGNEEYGHIGLVERVKALEKFRAKAEKIENKIIGGGLALGFLLTAAIELIQKFIK